MRAFPAQFCQPCGKKGHHVSRCKAKEGAGHNVVMAVGSIEELAPPEDESPVGSDVELGAYIAHPDEGKCLISVGGGLASSCAWGNNPGS